MDSMVDHLNDLNEANMQRLKEKYSQEMRDDADNPIKICMKLIYQAALERDPQKRQGLAYDLAKFLIQPNGVINLFLTLIDFDTSSQQVTTHTQRFIAVSTIITCLPKLCLPYAEYCDNILKQLKHLLISDNKKYSSLASIIIKSMLDSPHARDKNIRAVVLDPICNSLSRGTNFLTPDQAILAIHNLIQNHPKSTLFVDVFPHLFYSLIKLYQTPSRLKYVLKASLVSILNDLEPGPACCLLEETIFHRRAIMQIYRHEADEDEISIKLLTTVSDSKSKESRFEDIKEVIVNSLLLGCDSELLILEFFFHFQAKMWAASNEEHRQQSAALIEPLLESSIQEESDRNNKLDLLSSITSHEGRALDLISRTLANYVMFLRSSDSSSNSIESQKLIDPSVDICIRILEILVLSFDQLDTNGVDRDMVVSKVLPLIKEINLHLAATHGSRDKLTQNLDSLIDRLETINSKGQQNSPDEEPGEKSMKREYDCMLKDLNDKLVPVRVHALIRLKQLLMTRAQFAITRIPRLFELVESTLADQEPYVFLSSINLMAEMAVSLTQEILPKLVSLYTSKDLEVQQRINVGEVLVRLAKQLNKTTPFYAKQIISALMQQAVKDSEELLRMSSLTSMGEICRNLGDSIGDYMLDILVCVERVLSVDSPNVICASVDLLRSTLMGLDKFTVESAQRELKSIYNLLKKLRGKTLDDKLCLQVDLALDEIDRLARDMLGLNPTNKDGLVKNIKLLSLLG